MHQIRRLFRRAARGKIAGCSTYDEAIGRHAASDEARIRNRHIADREIEALLHQIDHSIGHRHVDRHVGIERDELGDDGSEKWRNCHRRVESQRAARRRLQGLGDPVGILDLREDLQAALIVNLTCLGQAHPARAAVEQANPEPLLEEAHMRRRHARGYAEGSRRGGKALALDHLHEGGHARHPVHVITRFPSGRHVPALSPYQVAPDHICSRLSVARRNRSGAPLSRLESNPVGRALTVTQRWRCEAKWGGLRPLMFIGRTCVRAKRTVRHGHSSDP